MFLTPFIFGVLGACLALVLEIILLDMGGIVSHSPQPTAFTALPTLLLVVLIEESARLLLLHRYVRHFLVADTQNTRRNIMSGLFFGGGFASLELTLLLQPLHAVPLLPLLGILFIHGVTSLLFLFFLTSPRANQGRFPLLIPFALAVLLHSTYNILALTVLF